MRLPGLVDVPVPLSPKPAPELWDGHAADRIGQVISGWDQGVQGMKVGGRRQLTIPAHLAYGNQSPTRAIKPGETLIFVVDLIGVS